jgi:hypothetical protein
MLNGFRRLAVAATVAGSMLVGGIGGAALYATTLAAQAASPSPSPSSSSGSATTPGKFVPNEDPAHEAGESAAREAQENAGQVPTVP